MTVIQNHLHMFHRQRGELYYAGGFNGGSTKKFMEMAEVLADRVTKI